VSTIYFAKLRKKLYLYSFFTIKKEKKMPHIS